MKVITVVSNEVGMIWNVHSYLENLQEIGWSKDTDVLVYCVNAKAKEWKTLEDIYPEVGFHYYQGDQFTKNVFPIYLPILRPFCLREHFKKFPELENQTIVYTDADILWTKKLDLDKYKEGCYVSSTVFPSDYQSHQYLLSKKNNVHPDKLLAYEKLDVLERLADICQISKQSIIDNYENCGGVQYILNGVDWKFWEKVMIDCLSIRVELQNLNQQFMKGDDPNERENNGFQSWCADLWSVFYNLIYLGKTIKAPRELDFSWSSDLKTRLESTSILHNAGITGDAILRTNVKGADGKWIYVDAPAFYKGKYLTSTPFTDIQSLKKVIGHEVTQLYCNHTYAEHILKVQEKYSLNY